MSPSNQGHFFQEPLFAGDNVTDTRIDTVSERTTRTRQLIVQRSDMSDQVDSNWKHGSMNYYQEACNENFQGIPTKSVALDQFLARGGRLCCFKSLHFFQPRHCARVCAQPCKYGNNKNQGSLLLKSKWTKLWWWKWQLVCTLVSFELDVPTEYLDSAFVDNLMGHSEATRAWYHNQHI